MDKVASIDAHHSIFSQTQQLDKSTMHNLSMTQRSKKSKMSTNQQSSHIKMLKEVSYQRPILVQVKGPKPLPTQSIMAAKMETMSPRDSVINYEELYSVG